MTRPNKDNGLYVLKPAKDESILPLELQVHTEPKSKHHTTTRPDFGPSQIKSPWGVKTGAIVIMNPGVETTSDHLVRVVYSNAKIFVAEEFFSNGSARQIHHGHMADFSVIPVNVENGLWNKINWISLPTEQDVRSFQKAEATWMSKKLGVGLFTGRPEEDVPQTIYLTDFSGIGMRQLDLGED